MSSWQRNEVRQAIENKFATHLPPEQAHALAELAVSAFTYFDDRSELIDVTIMGSADEEAIRQRYIAARLYYGGGERLSRPRRPRQEEWTTVPKEGE